MYSPKSKKTLALLPVLLLVTYVTLKTPSAHAQQTPSVNDEQIPSDLSLDLDLAEKNPAPQQKLLQEAQAEKAQIITSNGEKTDIPVKENIPQEIKTQPAQAAENPNQTTSEQVINKTVIEENSNKPQSSTAPLDSTNTIPGTNILEPDDNAVLAEPTASASPPTTNENQTNPQSSPSGSGADNPVQPMSSPSQPDAAPPSSSSNIQQPASTNNSSDQSNTIPPENGATQNSNPPPQSNQSSDPSNKGSSDSGGDNSAVQGVSTGAEIFWWKQLLNRIIGILK